MSRADELVADCSRCAALCCVMLPFTRAAGFGADKAAGDPCRNLAADFRCTIHATLRRDGWPGCTVYDCHGAGQKVTQVTFGGRTWREDPAVRTDAPAVLSVVRRLHDMLWYLHAAATHPDAAPAAVVLEEAFQHVDALTRLGPDDVLRVDVEDARAVANRALDAASDAVRRGARPRGARPLPRRVRPRADLVGARLAGADLRGADLRGALLIAADLAGADLGRADVLGADLRDADVRGTDLSRALGVGQMQVNAARGDAATLLPPLVRRPTHWA